jgi:hypothetical protein
MTTRDQNDEIINAGLKIGIGYGLYRWIFPKGAVTEELNGWEQAIAETFGLTVLHISQLIAGLVTFFFIMGAAIRDGQITGVLSFVLILAIALGLTKLAVRIAPVIVGVGFTSAILGLIYLILKGLGCSMY